MRRFVIGDIHGNYSAMINALNRASFQHESDELYAVGDYIDRHGQSKEVIDYLLSLPNFRGCLGNHDEFMLDWFSKDDEYVPFMWYGQGGKETLESYGIPEPNIPPGVVPESHIDFLRRLEPFIELDDGRICIVHAGWKPAHGKASDSNSFKDKKSEFWWDREFWKLSEEEPFPDYDKVFIGHTPVGYVPQKKGNVWNLDTRAGYDGKVTVMDIDTEEYWQGD